jgi:hypothetical protein
MGISLAAGQPDADILLSNEPRPCTLRWRFGQSDILQDKLPGVAQRWHTIQANLRQTKHDRHISAEGVFAGRPALCINARGHVNSNKWHTACLACTVGSRKYRGNWLWQVRLPTDAEHGIKDDIGRRNRSVQLVVGNPLKLSHLFRFGRNIARLSATPSPNQCVPAMFDQDRCRYESVAAIVPWTGKN